jgi:hypothetical protein
METGSKGLLLSEEEKSLGEEVLRPSMGLNQLVEVGEGYE